MRKSILILFALSIFHASSAQDSTSISFSEETGDTLIKQRFIDRYENVFMTKVPTRQMFKIGYSSSDFRGTGFQLGYEYKILPALSVEAALYLQTSPYNWGILFQNRVNPTLWAQIRGRWYYDMKKRMRNELSANNFSGRYIGVYFDHVTNLVGEAAYNKRSNRLGLLFGFQSRFFNRGYVDFAVGLFNRETWMGYTPTSTHHFFKKEDFVLATQPTIGIAFGDWKRAAQTPACDVLLCDERIQGQWKLRLPDAVIGWTIQRAETGLAYERKIGSSPFSVEAGLTSWARRFYTRHYDKSFNYYATGQLELRYYFLQKTQIRRGLAGNNFSGPYGGVAASYTFSGYHYKDRFRDQTGRVNDWESRTANIQASVGYQQRFFGRLYLDASVYYSKVIHYSFDRLHRPYGLSSRVSIGFTF